MCRLTQEVLEQYRLHSAPVAIARAFQEIAGPYLAALPKRQQVCPLNAFAQVFANRLHLALDVQVMRVVSGVANAAGLRLQETARYCLSDDPPRSSSSSRPLSSVPFTSHSGPQSPASPAQTRHQSPFLPSNPDAVPVPRLPRSRRHTPHAPPSSSPLSNTAQQQQHIGGADIAPDLGHFHTKALASSPMPSPSRLSHASKHAHVSEIGAHAHAVSPSRLKCQSHHDVTAVSNPAPAKLDMLAAAAALELPSTVDSPPSNFEPPAEAAADVHAYAKAPQLGMLSPNPLRRASVPQPSPTASTSSQLTALAANQPARR